MPRKPTISDVAQKAGVGKVTVSYVLNGQAQTARISKTTADRVLQAAVDLNYRPNAHARKLANKRAEALGIVFQYADYFGSQSSFITEVLRSVCQACVEADVDVLLHTKPTDDNLAEANSLSDGRVDAVVVIRDENDPVHSLLLERNFPAVLFFCRSDRPDAAFVSCDNYSGGRLAVNHLLQLGHRRIAMVKGGPGSVDSNDRYHGYLSSLASAGIAADPRDTIHFENSLEAGKEFIAMMSRPDRPTAVFCWSDDSAIECIRLCQFLELRVPDDVSVIGFDGTYAGERCHPPLTSIRQPIEEIAATAVNLALAIARDPHTPDRQFVLPPSLVHRQSTAPPANASHQVFLDNEVKSP